MSNQTSNINPRMPTLQEALLILEEQLRLPDWAKNVGQRPSLQNPSTGISSVRFISTLELQPPMDAGKV